MNSKTIQNSYHDKHRQYCIRYVVDSYSLHERDSGERTVIITASTEQSAVNQFYQMFHECLFIDIKEINNES